MGKTGVGAVDIPPNTVQLTEVYFPLRQAARIESFQPHMHLRGKAMTLEAVLPTGTSVVLSHVAEFDFNWHNSYVYADHAAPLLPKGTIIKVKAWHDNTAASRGNPDPNVWVGYGQRTVDEMAHAWVNVTYFTDEEYAAEVAARQAQQRSATADRQQLAETSRGRRADSRGPGRAVAGRADGVRGGRGRARRSHATRLPAEPLGGGGPRRSSRCSKAGDRTRTARPSSCSATTTAIARPSVDIPIGPDNRIEPGGPDYGQPTHFEPSQQHGVFAIKVPATFGATKLTWTLKANGQEAKVTFWLNPPYWVDFFKNAATLQRAAARACGSRRRPSGLTGPPLGFAQTLTGTVGAPVPLQRCGSATWPGRARAPTPNWPSCAARRRRPPTRSRSSATSMFGGAGEAHAPGRQSDVLVHWHKYRGPGAVTFAPARVPVVTGGDADEGRRSRRRRRRSPCPASTCCARR